MTRQDLIAFAAPVLIGVAMIFGTTCSHAQPVPPAPEWSWRSLLVWQVPPPPPKLLLEYRTGPHWCQTPDNTAFYSSKDLVNWTLYTGTNPFTADDSLRLFIAWHWCSDSDTKGSQCEVRLTRL